MKKFVYQVAGFEFVGYEAWGDAWKQAKALATERHAAVYRLVIKGEKVTQEVFCKAGCFLVTYYADADSIKIF